MEHLDGAPLERPAEVAPPPLRLAVGLGDPARERALLSVLGESGSFAAERCLSADQLLAALQTGRVDAALLAADLHRLGEQTLREIGRTGVPVVILAPPSLELDWPRTSTVLPLDAPPGMVGEAMLAAIRGERSRSRPHPAGGPTPLPRVAPAASETAPLALLAVASGHGSPGRTTVALNLATALGAVAPTLLVELDLGGASVAAFLDLDPTCNLAMLAHAAPETPRDWERALAQETRALARRSPHGAVLCGVPKPELRANLSPRFVERFLAEARRRYRYLIVDVGTELHGSDGAVHRLALGLADQVLLVTSADLVGLSHARDALAILQAQLGRDRDRIALLVNRHDRRFHHARAEIEWALGTPVAAVLPEDQPGAQRALEEQRPLVLNRWSCAGRGLLDLAERINGGKVVLPPEEPNRRRRWPWGPVRPPRLPWLSRPRRVGATDGSSNVAIP